MADDQNFFGPERGGDERPAAGLEINQSFSFQRLEGFGNGSLADTVQLPDFSMGEKTTVRRIIAGPQLITQPFFQGLAFGLSAELFHEIRFFFDDLFSCMDVGNITGGSAFFNLLCR